MGKVLSAACLAGVMTVSALVGSTAANATAFNSYVNPSDKYVWQYDPYDYYHTISGFNSATDTVTDAKLEITLSDYSGSEHIWYNFDGNWFDQYNTGNSSHTYTFDFGSLSILSSLSDGVLHVTLTASSGGYIFENSRLSGHFTSNEQVAESNGDGLPEPGTLLVLGTGLLGLGVSRMRKAH